MTGHQAIDPLAALAKGFDAQLVAELARQIAGQLPVAQCMRYQLITALIVVLDHADRLKGEAEQARKLPKAARDELARADTNLSAASTALHNAIEALQVYTFCKATGAMP